MEGRALIVIGPQYEDLEAWYPMLRLKEAGMDVTITGPEAREYEGKKGHRLKADASAMDLAGERFDVLVIVGGWAPDATRQDPGVLRLVVEHMKDEAVVGVICHGGWVMASAGVLQGRRVTSFPSLRDDLVNAGAEHVDEEVVVDKNLVTSRNPFDLPAFCREILNLASRQIAAVR